MRKIILSFCLLVMSVISIKAQDLEKLVNDKETFLVDVRTPEEFAQSNVEGSVNIPLQVLHQNLGQLKGKKNIVVFCEKGIRAAKAEKLLKENGIEVVNGGTWRDIKALKTDKKLKKNTKK